MRRLLARLRLVTLYAYLDWRDRRPFIESLRFWWRYSVRQRASTHIRAALGIFVAFTLSGCAASLRTLGVGADKPAPLPVATVVGPTPVRLEVRGPDGEPAAATLWGLDDQERVVQATTGEDGIAYLSLRSMDVRWYAVTPSRGKVELLPARRYTEPAGLVRLALSLVPLRPLAPVAAQAPPSSAEWSRDELEAALRAALQRGDADLATTIGRLLAAMEGGK